MEKQMKAMGWMRGVILCGMLTACSTSAQTTAQQAQSERVKIAQAKFEEHCKGAGEKIVRTVDKVEGVYLLKLRPETRNFGNQYVMDDPYGDDSSGERYIQSFLRGLIYHPERPLAEGSPRRMGYLYADAVDPKDGQRYRYTGRWIEPWQTDKTYLKDYMKFVMDREPTKGAPPRYGVTYDDISTREDREHWIAGSSLRVIDMQTNEVIAERIGYMWDPAQGASGGGRSPWMAAASYACPGFNRYPGYVPREPGFSMQAQQTEDFVEKILIPKSDK